MQGNEQIQEEAERNSQSKIDSRRRQLEILDASIRSRKGHQEENFVNRRPENEIQEEKEVSRDVQRENQDLEKSNENLQARINIMKRRREENFYKQRPKNKNQNTCTHLEVLACVSRKPENDRQEEKEISIHSLQEENQEQGTTRENLQKRINTNIPEFENQERRITREVLQRRINAKKQQQKKVRKQGRKIEKKFEKICRKISKRKMPTLVSVGRKMIQEHLMEEVRKEIKRILTNSHLSNLNVRIVIKELKKTFPTKFINKRKQYIKARVNKLAEKMNGEVDQQ
jgi:hypothetical protein